jgi:hypothetical protein
MEEINLFLNDKITIYYLNIFDNNIKDENYFKLGDYILEDDILKINYDNGESLSYSYLKTDNNIKYYGDISTMNNTTYENFDESSNNLLYDTNMTNMTNMTNIQNNTNFIYIVHTYWEDRLTLDNNICYRTGNYDKGKYILNNDYIIIKWDNYNEEKFLLNIDDKKYYFKSDHFEQNEQNEQNEYNKNINDNTKILIKNFSWEDNVILDNITNKCIRMNINEDSGIFSIDGNYLFIKWDEWESEVFYKSDNYYINNKTFIKNKKFILKDISLTYDIDKEYIYINENKYKYNIINKKLIINEYNSNSNEFILLDDEYYSIYYFEKYNLHGEIFNLFKNENIILNNLYIIIAKYNKMNANILNIQWYNDNNFYYKLQQNNENNDLIKLFSIEIKNDFIQKYYIVDNLLYDEHFNNFIEFITLDETHLILNNNLKYVKKNNIFILEEDNKNNTKNKEINLYEYNQFETFYYDNNYLIHSDKNTNYLCLMDNSHESIHIKKDEHIQIFNQLYDNHYLINDKYNEIINLNFDESIFKYFENYQEKDNLIKNILNEEIIFSQKTFNKNFIFLENIDFSTQNNIFDIYGYFIIKEYNWDTKNNTNKLTIVNFKNNNNFMEKQDLWIEYLNKHQQFIILIFDDFSHYEFINEIINFHENFKNYIIIINYSKCVDMIHFYLNKLINNIENNHLFTSIYYLSEIENNIEDIKEQNKLIINKEFYQLITTKEDFILFMIYFYIKNRDIIKININNFSISFDNYKKIQI